MLNEQLLVENVLNGATTNFKRMLRNYYPARPTNIPHESNTTHQFALSFANIFGKNANVFFEIPVKNRQSVNYDNKFDAFVFNKDIGFIIESKRLINNWQIEIDKDVNKIQSNFKGVMGQFFKNKPKTICALILAMDWHPGQTNLLESLDIFGGYHFGKKCIIKYEKNDQLFWLYAVKKICS